MQEEQVDGIIHLAAESHVDRSIKNPFTFARTNVMGTLSLLQAAKLYWESLPEKYGGKMFYHISTDEVYGALTMNHRKALNLRLPQRQVLAAIILHTVMISSMKRPNITLTHHIAPARQVQITS